MSEYEGKSLEELIDELGKTMGLATYLTLGVSWWLEYNTKEAARDYIYETLADFIDE